MSLAIFVLWAMKLSWQLLFHYAIMFEVLFVSIMTEKILIFQLFFPLLIFSVIFYDFLTDYSVFYILYIALLAIVYYIK